MRIGAERAHVQHALHAHLGAGGRERGRQRDVRALEAGPVWRAAAAVQHADQVDRRVRTGDEARERARVERFELDDFDRQHLQVARVVAPARADPHLLAGFDQRIDEPAADEAGAAQQRDGLAIHVVSLKEHCRVSRGSVKIAYQGEIMPRRFFNDCGLPSKSAA